MSEALLACHVLSRNGLPLAEKLAKELALHPWRTPSGHSVGRCVISAPARFAGEGILPFQRLGDFLAEEYSKAAAHVFVGAAGVAARALAPHIKHKSKDPPALVLDTAGRFVISLLSGHWGGGNDLARHVARLLRAMPVITTATDSATGEGKDAPALDLLLRDAGLTILDWDMLPRAQAAWLEGQNLQLWDPCAALSGVRQPRLERLPANENDDVPRANRDFPLLAVHWRFVPPAPGVLRLAVPRLCVGVGCRKNLAPGEVLSAIKELFIRCKLELRAVAALATVTEKKDDDAVRCAAEQLQVPLRGFSADALSQMPTPHPSRAAGERFACKPFSVCESAALCDGGRLLVQKRVVNRRVTLAVALVPAAGGAKS